MCFYMTLMFKKQVNHIYCGVLSSIVADDTEASRVSLGPLSDVVNLSVYDQPLVVPAAVALHLLPGVQASGSPDAWLRQLAPTSHPHPSLPGLDLAAH